MGNPLLPAATPQAPSKPPVTSPGWRPKTSPAEPVQAPKTKT